MRVTCPCRRRLEAPEDFGGRTVRCPDCGRALRLPGDDPTAAGTSAGADPRPAGVRRRAPARRRSVVHEAIERSERAAGADRKPLHAGRRRPPAWAVAAATVLGSAAVVAAVWLLVVGATSGHDVWLVNGLDIPVTATFEGPDDAPATRVAAGSRERMALDPGTWTARFADDKGNVVDEATMTITGEHDLAAFNVAGAACIWLAEAHYTGPGAPPPAPAASGDTDSLRHWADQVTVQWEHANYVFRDPPAWVHADEGGSARTVAGVVPGGWRSSVVVLRETDGPLAALGLVDRIMVAQPRDREPALVAAALLAEMGREHEIAQYLADHGHQAPTTRELTPVLPRLYAECGVTYDG